MPTELENNEKEKIVIRDSRGRIISGSGGINPNGARGRQRFDAAQITKRFLATRDEDEARRPDNPRNVSKFKKLLEVSYEIAKNPEHRNCTAEREFLIRRAFGDVPKEISVNVAVMQALQTLPPELYEYLADRLSADDEVPYLPTFDGSAQDKIENDPARLPPLLKERPIK